MTAKKSFLDILRDAIDEFAKHGFVSNEQLAFWTDRIRRAAEAAATPPHVLEQMMRDALGANYQRLVAQQGVLKMHPGVSRFTLEKVAPQLRAELDRRVVASANLIKLNRSEAVQKTLQRFQGWATSVPNGGTKTSDRGETKGEIRKALAQLPFVERRVLIDQGHKLTASINEVVARGGGAIALIWRSHWRQAGYDYRPDHKDRDGKVYLIRGNWASEDGFVKAGPAGYYDAVTAVAQEPFCRCAAQYLYNLRDLPDDMLTVKGRETLERVRVA